MLSRTATEPIFDLLIKNVRVVRPHVRDVELLDLGIKDGKFTRVAPNIDAHLAQQLHDGRQMLGFPGLVDAHMHVGIYRPLAEDARSESRAAAMGGVTSALTYMRTGQYYLNRGGPYREFFPEVLKASTSNYYVDYGYHVAPITGQHIDEMELLATEFGVPSFKIFMFYGNYGLHGRSDLQREFLMLGKDERYDYAHFEFIMRRAAELSTSHPRLRDCLSVSLHCEVADILNAYTRLVERDGKLQGLRAYNAARPPHSEALAIWIASYLAHETNCLNINLLHLSSRKAIEAALMMANLLPHVTFRREVTLGHLLIDVDSPAQNLAKVNPPIRPREDVEYLWNTVLDGMVDWICTDHACCSSEIKLDASDVGNVWLAKAGFGGAEYLLSGVFSEGKRRGLPVNCMAQLLSWNPAQRFGLLQKGDIAVGYDADLVLLDPNETFVVRAEDSPSEQGYSPFEGIELTGRVKSTFLRGHLIFHNGEVIGAPLGEYLRRPGPLLGTHQQGQ